MFINQIFVFDVKLFDCLVHYQIFCIFQKIFSKVYIITVNRNFEYNTINPKNYFFSTYH